MLSLRNLIVFTRHDPGADVLVVTNMWPEPERPVYGIHVRRQVESLVESGLRCDVLYLRGYASPVGYPLAAARFLWTSVAWRGRYRLIHVYAGETALAARFHVGTPMVVSYCGDDLLGDRRDDGTTSRASRIRAGVLRAHSRLFTRTITKSREMEGVLPRSVRRRNAVIANGVDVSLFRPQPRGEARATLGWGADERVVLFAATKPESPAKRLWLARAACELAAEAVGPVRLEVAAGVDPRKMPLLVNAADCLLATSAVEGSPNAVKEALMCNLPVVATPAGDIEDLLAGVEPSWLCAPSAQELASALVSCFETQQRSNGRAVTARLTEQVVAERVLAVYRDATGDSALAARLPADPERDGGVDENELSRVKRARSGTCGSQ